MLTDCCLVPDLSNYLILLSALVHWQMDWTSLLVSACRSSLPSMSDSDNEQAADQTEATYTSVTEAVSANTLTLTALLSLRPT